MKFYWKVLGKIYFTLPRLLSYRAYPYLPAVETNITRIVPSFFLKGIGGRHQYRLFESILRFPRHSTTSGVGAIYSINRNSTRQPINKNCRPCGRLRKRRQIQPFICGMCTMAVRPHSRQCCIHMRRYERYICCTALAGV